jgi:hypothetical protein
VRLIPLNLSVLLIVHVNRKAELNPFDNGSLKFKGGAKIGVFGGGFRHLIGAQLMVSK